MSDNITITLLKIGIIATYVTSYMLLQSTNLTNIIVTTTDCSRKPWNVKRATRPQLDILMYKLDYQLPLKCCLNMWLYVILESSLKFYQNAKFVRCMYDLNFREIIVFIQQYSVRVEKYLKTRSRFIRKNQHFFRQMNVFTYT